MLYPGNYRNEPIDGYIRAMFDHTVNNWLTIFKSEFDIRAYRMQWTEQDVVPFTDQVRTMLANFDRIGQLYDQLGATKEENRELLSPALLGLWDTCIRKIEPQDFDPELIRQLREKQDGGESLSEEEQDILERYENALECEALKRLPAGGIPSYTVIRRCWRYTRLVSLNAPQIIVKNEARMLTEALTLYTFAIPKLKSQ